MKGLEGDIIVDCTLRIQYLAKDEYLVGIMEKISGLTVDKIRTKLHNFKVFDFGVKDPTICILHLNELNDVAFFGKLQNNICRIIGHKILI